MNRRASWWLAAVWTICLIIASLQPFRPGSRGHSFKHQILHVVVFGATALVYRRVMRGGAAFAGVVLLAVLIETAQYAIYRMAWGFEWWDVREDAIGAAVALITHALRFPARSDQSRAS